MSGVRAQVTELLARAGVKARLQSITPCGRGGNNRIYRVETSAGLFAAKQYFRHAGDTRDRLASEYSFLTYAQGVAPGTTPRPYACAPDLGMALLEFIDGRALQAVDIGAAQVDAAIQFFRDLNTGAAQAALDMPLASEASFSIRDHLAVIQGRIERLLAVSPQSDVDAEAVAVFARLGASWTQVADRIRDGAARARLDLDEPTRQRCVSPSDFGFHNALATPEGAIRFLDFEYAGWDDAAKMAGDFFAQLAVPVPMEFYEPFVHRCMDVLPEPAAGVERAMLLRPAYQIKWCCIALNVFLPVHLARRRFANPALDEVAAKKAQLDKAERLLQSVNDGR